MQPTTTRHVVVKPVAMTRHGTEFATAPAEAASTGTFRSNSAMLVGHCRDDAVAGGVIVVVGEPAAWLPCWREAAFPVLLKDFPVAKLFPRQSDKILRNRKNLRKIKCQLWPAMPGAAGVA
jgi:hypothetical protein